ncbi:hypothetical protein [Clostridium beijerinckii]|uniref:hypothetical protein n=1 Tax=Clostridium beijerinckii TaxID=1520 RepID=UPI00047DAA9D|nr:hypothetical protein [Clostridium beijerinckii]
MPTKQITVRLEDELEKKVQFEIQKIKAQSRGGSEINLSSVIRYSLEKYVQEQNELDNGVITLKFNVNKISKCDLKRLETVGEQLTEIFDSGYEETMELVKGSFDLDQAIQYKLYQEEKLMQGAANYELTEDEKKYLKTKED